MSNPRLSAVQMRHPGITTLNCTDWQSIDGQKKEETAQNIN